MTRTPAAMRTGWRGASAISVVFFAVLMLTASLAQAQVVGKVLAANGQVQAQRPDGSTRTLFANAVIERGDTVITGTNAAAQLRFLDGALVTLQPETRFRIDEYYYAGGSGQDRSFFSLLKGGLRALSGLIGKVRHDAYRMETPVATVGIRGTDYELRLCQGDCPAGSPDGLYLGVGYGAIAATNHAGSFDLQRGQYGYIKDAQSPMQFLSCPPMPLTGVACPASALDPTDFGAGYPTGDQDPISGDRPVGLGVGSGCGGSYTGFFAFQPVPACP